MSFSIIIPSYNSSSTILTVIGHINIHDERIKEITIVDSSDDEESQKLLNDISKYSKVKIIHLSNKTIPAIARNIGAQQSNGEMLVFLDSDVFPCEDWITNIERSNKAGISVGGGSIDLPLFQKNNGLAISQYFLQFNEFLPELLQRNVPFIPSCNLFCSRNIFTQVGGFPEIRASEDVLFGNEVRNIEPMCFIPNIKVYHIFGTCWKRYRNNQILLGKYVAIYRKTTKNKLLYSRPIQFFLIPVIPIVKYFLLLSRIIKTNRRLLLLFLKSTIKLISGILFWSIGYYIGIFGKKEYYE